MPSDQRPALVLASSSRYRRELLQRLGLEFSCDPPRVDETALPAEAPRELACRLAMQKAREVAARHSDAVVIGSDQVAGLDGTTLGKPGDRERAARQLRACSGQRVEFHTAVCVIETRSQEEHALVDLTEVQFRRLTDAEISRYLEADSPYDCAGSFKCESLGITLFEHVRSDDPTALVGLPLIGLAHVLRRCGFRLP